MMSSPLTGSRGQAFTTLSGQVRYAVMEFRGFLGMGTDQDGYVVPLDKAQLEQAPRYADDKVPNYDDAYNVSVNKYYGL